jgi:hypothetical protein
MAAVVDLASAFDAVSTPQARSGVIPFVTANPLAIKEPIPGKDTTLLHHIVAIGNVGLLRDIVKIPGVWFPLGFEDADGRTLREVNDSSPPGTSKRNMEVYLNFLKEWDDICELAKNYIHSENEKVWAWLRRNAQHCYSTPPSRKWSIAMQVVYSGNVEYLSFMLSMCPQARGAVPIWEARGNDGMTLMDVADMDEVKFEYPDMYDFVRDRVEGVVHTVQKNPSDDLEKVRLIWDSIRAANTRRPVGECPISGERVPLHTCSRDCNHAFSAQALSNFFQAALRSGPFPLRCPLCAAERQDRGLITRGPIKDLVSHEIISRNDGERVLNQQIRSLPDEASLDLQYSMSKPCPYCTAPIAHYKGHGCHHIRPGGGCPSCHHHFCYTCLSSHDDGTTWQGCPNDDELSCNENCDCPLCPDCTPGNPCDACDGVGSACPRCRMD